VQINKAIDLPEDLCRDVYVEYSFYLDPAKYRTEVSIGNNRSPEIDYKHKHTVEIVTKMLVDYLEQEVMVFRVYGFADVKSKPKKEVKKPQVRKPVQSAQQSFFGNDSTMDNSMDTSITSNNTSGRVANAVSVQQSSTAIKVETNSRPAGNSEAA